MKKFYFLQKNIQMNKKGFTLIEALVAIFILSVSITSLLTVVTQSVFNSIYIKNKAVAISLAQEGVELVRNIQDSALLETEYPTFNAFIVDNLRDCSPFSISGVSLCTIEPVSLNINSCANSGSDVLALCSPLYLSEDGYFNYNTNGELTPFTRSIKVVNTGTKSGLVTVDVSWMQGNFLRKVSYKMDLFLWIN